MESKAGFLGRGSPKTPQGNNRRPKIIETVGGIFTTHGSDLRPKEANKKTTKDSTGLSFKKIRRGGL